LFNIKLIIISILLSLCVIACVSNTGLESNRYHGKWTLNKVIYDDGDFKDLSDKSGHFINIGKTEVSEIMAEYGVRTYPYTQEGDVFTVTTGTRDVTWTIIESSEHSMKIDTPIGRYVLTR
jgi:hypothetical protein